MFESDSADQKRDKNDTQNLTQWLFRRYKVDQIKIL